MQSLVQLLLLILVSSLVFADLPMHCEFADVHGNWTIYATALQHDASQAFASCTPHAALAPTEIWHIELASPNVIKSQNVQIGTWTLIYDQGFELSFSQSKYFSFFNYTTNATHVTSYCGSTLVGTFHPAIIKAPLWGCFVAVKREHVDPRVEPLPQTMTFGLFENDDQMIDAINAKQSSWKAKRNEKLQGIPWPLLNVNRVSLPRIKQQKRYMSHKKQTMQNNMDLPKSWDWRNVSGINYMSPVRDQQLCGSCYAFSVMGMLEARARIMSNNSWQPIFSPQDVVSCSYYTQQCDGGFPYLVSKYAQDFGIIAEKCNTYKGVEFVCVNQCPPEQRTFVRDYQYIGGYYGATNEHDMMTEIVNHGPIAGAFEVYKDFYNYHTGVYHHIPDLLMHNNNDPHFEVTNHAIVILGYGETEQGEKYWICKNSWATTFGEDGYFRIRRGVDECAIESLAVAAKLDNDHIYE